MSGGKGGMVEIIAIVFFFITGFLIFLPSIAKVMGSFAYIAGIIILICVLITAVWSLAGRL